MGRWARLLRTHLFDVVSISCSPGCLDPDVAKKTVPEQSKRIITLWLYDDLQLQTHIYLGDLPVPITFQPTYFVLRYRNSADQNKTHTHFAKWSVNAHSTHPIKVDGKIFNNILIPKIYEVVNLNVMTNL